MSKPVTMHCTYHLKPGQEAAFLPLLQKHWSTLRKAGLTTETPATVYRATDKTSGRVFYVEIFSWRDEQAPGTAHQLPEVMAVWEPMGPMLEGERGPSLAVITEVGVDR